MTTPSTLSSFAYLTLYPQSILIKDVIFAIFLESRRSRLCLRRRELGFSILLIGNQLAATAAAKSSSMTRS